MEPLQSKYVVGGELAAPGGTGLVRRGQSAAGHDVAIKFLRPDLVANPQAYANFMQLWPALVGLGGPHLVGVRELVTQGDTFAVVMDFVPGGDLAAYLAETGPMLPVEIARVGGGIAEALALAHASNVVHGDLKPSNVLMRDGEPLVGDFQISWTLLGTPGPSSLPYTAPEVLMGGRPSAASDVYALGVLLYEMCCTVTPFAADSDRQIRFGHTSQTPGMPPGVPPELWDAISRMLAKNPAERPHAFHVAEALYGMTDRLAAYPQADRLAYPPKGPSIGPAPVGITPLEAFPVAPPQKKGNKMARRGVAVLGVLALLGAGTWFFTSRSADAPTTTGSVLTTTNPAPQAAAVTTTSARPSTMPKLVGRTLGDAQDELPRTVEIEPEYVLQPGTKDGTILKQDPEEGAPLGSAVKLTVARDYATQYLDTVTPASGRWDNAQVAAIAGEPIPHAVTDTLNKCTSLRSVEYALSRGYRKFVARAGLTDGSNDASVEVQFEVFADNRSVYKGVLRYNAITEIDVDMTKVARLKIQWQPSPAKDTCGGSATMALGQAALLGIDDEMPLSGTPRGSTTVTTTSR